MSEVMSVMSEVTAIGFSEYGRQHRPQHRQDKEKGRQTLQEEKGYGG